MMRFSTGWRMNIVLVLVVLKVLVMPTVEAVFSSNPIDLMTVYTGVLQPENVMIHVIQNLWNFLTSTLFWMISIPFYNDPASSTGRTFADSRALNSGKRTGHYVANLFRVAADTAETFGRFFDEL